MKRKVEFVCMATARPGDLVGYLTKSKKEFVPCGVFLYSLDLDWSSVIQKIRNGPRGADSVWYAREDVLNGLVKIKPSTLPLKWSVMPWQLIAVRSLMRDYRWHQIKTISEQCHILDQSASARIRDLRKKRHGGYKVLRRELKGATRRVYEYRLVKKGKRK
jgi:hypothetical protein